MQSNLFVVITYFILNLLFSYLCYYLNAKELKELKRKINDCSANIQDYADLVESVAEKVKHLDSYIDDLVESIAEKVKHLESYLTDLESKIIALKTDIELLKQKKTGVSKNPNKKI